MLLQMMQKAQRDNVLAIQDTIKGDSASLMSRFGALTSMLQAAKG